MHRGTAGKKTVHRNTGRKTEKVGKGEKAVYKRQERVCTPVKGLEKELKHVKENETNEIKRERQGM